MKKLCRLTNRSFFSALVIAGVLLFELSVLKPNGYADCEEASGDKYPKYGLTSIFRNDFPFIIEEGEVNPVSVPPVRENCGVKLLSHGNERLKWRLDLLRRARRSMKIQTYIFSADEAGKKVSQLMIERRGEGLDVRLTIDTYTKFRPADRALFNSLEVSGIIVMGFEPWYLLGTSERKFMDFGDVNMRFHEKYWVADESVAIIGGANIANEYFRYGDKPGDMWRDQDVLLTGSVVKDISQAFHENQLYFSARRHFRLPINRATFFREPLWKITGTTPPPIIDSVKPAVEMDAEDLDAAGVTVRFIRHRPRKKENFIYQAYLHLIDNARKSILIENAYFVPSSGLITALMKAAKRNVKVVVITNSEKTNDVKGMAPLSRYSYLPLINSGVEIYEWHGSNQKAGSLHSKFAVFDDQVSVIGSCNLDPRSFNINSENVVLIDSNVAAAKLTEFVNVRDFRNCRKITLEQAAGWHKPIRTAEIFRLKFGMTMKSWY